MITLPTARHSTHQSASQLKLKYHETDYTFELNLLSEWVDPFPELILEMNQYHTF